LHQVSQLLIELRKYTFFHFSTEEEYMEKINFKELDKPVKLEKIIDYLEAWVFNHILIEDQKLAHTQPQAK